MGFQAYDHWQSSGCAVRTSRDLKWSFLFYYIIYC